MAAAAIAIDLKDHRIARLTLDADLWLCAKRTAWPAFAWFETWLLVGRWTREVDFVRSPATQRVMRTLLVVPCNNEVKFPLERCLVLGHSDLPQEFLGRPVEAFHNSNGTMLADRTEPRQDVPR